MVTQQEQGPVAVYAEYGRERVGWFFGLTGWQLVTLAAAGLPVFWAIRAQVWTSAGLLALVWLAVAALTVVPVRGRSAVGWLVACGAYAVGALTGWSRFRARAAAGRAGDLDAVDLPGVLAGVQIHDGPPWGPTSSRVAIIQDHATRRWAVTASLVHPGIGLAGGQERRRFGSGLSELLEVACRGGLVEEVQFIVRTVPDDGAERDVYVQRHRRPGGPGLARLVNDALREGLTRAAVRTEAFVTVVVREARLAREARECGGGLEGRARVLYSLMGEVEAQLRGGLGMTAVTWLTSPQLALACRTAFAPGDRAVVVDAAAALARQGRATADPTLNGQPVNAVPVSVNAEVPWALAGPSGAQATVRAYAHDAWHSVSSTIKLPDRGAVLGALAPVLVPAQAGERRSLVVVYPIVAPGRAQRQSGTRQWGADLGEALRDKAKVRRTTAAGDEAARARGTEAKLARGAALTHPYAVATITTPRAVPAAEAGRRLDSSIRTAGFAPLRLDLAQDAAFAASTVPLGITLTGRGDR